MKTFKRKKKSEDLSELYKSFTKVEPREIKGSELVVRSNSELSPY